MAGDGPVQFILDGFEKGLGDGGILAVVDTALLVDIGNFKVEAALARPDGAKGPRSDS